jgi:hypothetical protein
VIEGSDHFHFCDGIELLHGLHEKNPRAGQARPTPPLADLIDEEEMHALLTARVTRFFDETFGIQRRAARDGIDRATDRDREGEAR